MTLFGITSDEPEIFANRDVLKDRFQPDTIVGRDSEKRELNNALRPVLKGTGSPDNVFMSGPTGTGKTALAKSATDEIAMDPHMDVDVAWVNCKPVGGDTQLMLEIANRFRPSGNKLSITGYSEKQAMDRLFSELAEVDAKTVLVVLDELDTVDDIGSFLYHLPRAHEHGLDETEVGVIAISNEPDFITDVPADVRSTLTDVHIQFSEYDATEIRAVLDHRSVLAFKDTELTDSGLTSSVVDSGAVDLAAAKGTKHTGDARMARDVLRMAGDHALDLGDDKITGTHVNDAVEKYHRSRMVDSISNFGPTAKNLLYALITLHADGQSAPRTSEIYSRYVSLLDDSGRDTVTKRQSEKHLKKFERVGLTDPERHGGRGGNYTTHPLQYDAEHLVEGIGEVIDRYGIHQSVRPMVETAGAD